MYRLRDRLPFKLRSGLYNKTRIREIPKIGRDATRHNVQRCKEMFWRTIRSFKFVFDLSMEKRNFHDDLKIARFNFFFIDDDRSKLGNYRPVSIFPCLKYLSVLCIIAFTNTS